MKKGKNVLEEKEFTDYVLQKRRVDRDGMKHPIEYDLKIPKSDESFEKIYGKGAELRMAIATLKTESDDAIEQTGQPMTIDRAIKGAVKVATAETKIEVAKLLGISITELEKMEKVATAEAKAKSKK